MLEISSETNAKKEIMGILTVCIIGAAALFYIDGAPLIFIFAFILTCFLIVAWCYISLFRKEYFSEEGITIEVFKHRRFIPWTAFSTIYMQKYSLPRLYKYPYTGAFVASLKPVFKPFGMTMKPDYYVMWHPFSFAFVYFPAEDSMVTHPRLRYPMFYPCDQELFMKRIAEWGIKYDTIQPYQ